MSDKPVPEHFAHCPRCGKTTIERFQENAIRCASCSFELFFNPTSSAAALILDKDKRLLAVERAREPSKGKFGIPGGFIDFNENAETALLREVKEETNLDLSGFQFLGSFPNLYPFKGVAYPVLDFYFTAQVDSFAAVRAEESEIASIQFVDPKAVPESQWAFDSLRKAISALNSSMA